MIHLSNNDSRITVAAIDGLMQAYDRKGVFATRLKWPKNFTKHFEQIIDTHQYLTVRKDGNLIGFCSWALVNKERKRQINKARWLLPENISDGDILYIDVCILKRGHGMNEIRRYLRAKYAHIIKEVFWFDVVHGKLFRANIKKELVHAE